jgi:hypothetical protein
MKEKQKRNRVTLESYIYINRRLDEGAYYYQIAEELAENPEMKLSVACIQSHFSRRGEYYNRTRDKFQPLVDLALEGAGASEDCCDDPGNCEEDCPLKVSHITLEGWNALKIGDLIYDFDGVCYKIKTMGYSPALSRKMAKGWMISHTTQDNRQIDTITDDFNAFFSDDPNKVEVGRPFRLAPISDTRLLRVGSTILRKEGMKSEVITGASVFNGAVEIDGDHRLFDQDDYLLVVWL